EPCPAAKPCSPPCQRTHSRQRMPPYILRGRQRRGQLEHASERISIEESGKAILRGTTLFKNVTGCRQGANPSTPRMISTSARADPSLSPPPDGRLGPPPPHAPRTTDPQIEFPKAFRFSLWNLGPIGGRMGFFPGTLAFLSGGELIEPLPISLALG